MKVNNSIKKRTPKEGKNGFKEVFFHRMGCIISLLWLLSSTTQASHPTQRNQTDTTSMETVMYNTTIESIEESITNSYIFYGLIITFFPNLNYKVLYFFVGKRPAPKIKLKEFLELKKARRPL